MEHIHQHELARDTTLQLAYYAHGGRAPVDGNYVELGKSRNWPKIEPSLFVDYVSDADGVSNFNALYRQDSNVGCPQVC